MRDRPEYARQIREALDDPRRICEALGLMRDRGSWVRQPRGLTVRCVWHDDHNPSLSVRVAGDGTISCKCHACQASGDVLDLIAKVHDLSTSSGDFKQVLLLGAEFAGLWGIIDELEGRSAVGSYVPPTPPPRPAPEPPRDYPPQAEVDALWAACVPTAKHRVVAAWLEARGLDPELVDFAGVARAIPNRCPFLAPWASYKGRSWVETGHQLILPMYAAYGAARSLRCGRVTEGADSPKRLPPGGFKGSELVMADEFGVAMLKGDFIAKHVLIVEGEPDFLTWATRRKPSPTAIFGIVSGSWTQAFAQRIPLGTQVVIATHHDEAGDRYAAAIEPTLRGRFVRRLPRGE